MITLITDLITVFNSYERILNNILTPLTVNTLNLMLTFSNILKRLKELQNQSCSTPASPSNPRLGRLYCFVTQHI